MNHKQMKRAFEVQQNVIAINKIKDDYASFVLRGQLLTILLILGDKFGFGKVRMERLLEHLANQTCIFYENEKAGVHIDAEEVNEILKKEYKLDFDEILQRYLKEKEQNNEI